MGKQRSFVPVFVLGIAVFAATGCQRDEVVEYTVAKETFPEVSNIQQQLREAHASFGMTHAPHSDGGHGHGPDHDHLHDHAHPPVSASGGELRFEAPVGWMEQPLTTMRQASFLVRDAENAIVDISVMSFPGDTGGVHANINRWREQVGLHPISGDQIDEEILRRTVNGDDYLIVDIPGADREEIASQRIVGAIHARGGRTWFFKMMGDDELTAAQREPLLHFLESVRYP